MTLYTTWGPVRGSCGHEHKSIDTADACLRRDGEGCAGQGGYTDRNIYALDADGCRRTLRENELPADWYTR